MHDLKPENITSKKSKRVGIYISVIAIVIAGGTLAMIEFNKPKSDEDTSAESDPTKITQPEPSTVSNAAPESQRATNEAENALQNKSSSESQITDTNPSENDTVVADESSAKHVEHKVEDIYGIWARDCTLDNERTFNSPNKFGMYWKYDNGTDNALVSTVIRNELSGDSVKVTTIEGGKEYHPTWMLIDANRRLIVHDKSVDPVDGPVAVAAKEANCFVDMGDNEWRTCADTVCTRDPDAIEAFIKKAEAAHANFERTMANGTWGQ